MGQPKFKQIKMHVSKITDTCNSSLLSLIAQMSRLPMSLLFPVPAAKEERLAKGKEKEEGPTKWAQGTSNGICPVPE